MKKKSLSFSKAEAAILSNLLETMIEDFRDNSCDEFMIEASDENKEALIELMDIGGRYSNDVYEEIREEKDEIPSGIVELSKLFIDKLNKMKSK